MDGDSSSATAAPISAAGRLLGLLKGGAAPAAAAPAPAPVAAAAEPAAGPAVVSFAELESAARYAPVKYKPPTASGPAAYEKIDENLLVFRLVAIIRASSLPVTLAQLQSEYRKTYPPLSPTWRLSQLLPPVKFHPHVATTQSAGGDLTFSFSSTPLPAAAVAPKASSSPSPAKVKEASPHSPTPVPIAAKEPTGLPRCGQLAVSKGGRAFDIQTTGQTLRNAAQLSSLIRRGLRVVVDAAGKMHAARGASGDMHLALINASLAVVPKENCTLWFVLHAPDAVVDVASHIEGAWGCSAVPAGGSDAEPAPTFAASKLKAWEQTVKQVWLLVSLPSRRLVTQKDGRLLILGGAPGRPCTHIGSSNGAWHVVAGSARENEVSEAAVAALKRAGALTLTRFDAEDRELFVEERKAAPPAKQQGGGAVGGGGSSIFQAFGSDSESDED